MEKTKEIKNIHKIINTHLRTLKEVELSDDDKLLEYDMLKCAVYKLMRHYSDNKDKFILTPINLEIHFTIYRVKESFFVYLIDNPWDSNVTELYELLTSI